jgi:hypothetical protein
MRARNIEMLESSGEVSNVEWIKLGESLITDKDADRLNSDGPFDGHPKPNCSRLAMGYGFARSIYNKRHGLSPEPDLNCSTGTRKRISPV